MIYVICIVGIETGKARRDIRGDIVERMEVGFVSCILESENVHNDNKRSKFLNVLPASRNSCCTLPPSTMLLVRRFLNGLVLA